MLFCVFCVETVLLIFFGVILVILLLLGFLLLAAAIPILFGDLGHNFIKSVGADGLDSLLLVYLIDWDSLALQSEEEEHELVDLLFEQFLILVLLAKLQAHMLLFLH